LSFAVGREECQCLAGMYSADLYPAAAVHLPRTWNGRRLESTCVVLQDGRQQCDDVDTSRRRSRMPDVAVHPGQMPSQTSGGILKLKLIYQPHGPET
jgi:hypothetical protein